MAASNKSQLLEKVHSLLAKRYPLEPAEGRLTVLEAVIHGICHEGTTREQANQAMGRFKDEFFDWNEVRVSSLDEIQEVLVGLPDPSDKAYRLRKFLRQLFERTYQFDLEIWTKKPFKEAIKALQDYEAGQSDYVIATVVQRALGGHALPIDEPVRRTLERLGVAEAGATPADLRPALERAVPKSRGTEFIDLLKELAQDTCQPDDPDCPACALVKICPTGMERSASASGKSSKTTGAKKAQSDGSNKPQADGSVSAKGSSKSDGKSSGSRGRSSKSRSR